MLKRLEEFSIARATVGRYDVEIHEDGSVEIEGECSCGHWLEMDLEAEELQALARKAAEFKELREGVRDVGTATYHI